MLSFKPINEELAVAEFEGEKIERRFSDDGYSFVAESLDACRAVYEYTRREEIPLVFSELPSALLGELLPLYRHADIDALDSSRSIYRVAIKSEAELLSEPPSIECDGVELSPLEREDIPEYYRLATDEKTNRYWNYDYRDDNPEADGEYFFCEQESDFARGAAITLAVRTEGRFIGEATLYGFDLAGGAYVALRLLPEWCSRGYGSRSLEAVFALAESIGLVKLFADVREENAPSLALFGGYMDEISREGGVVRFELSAEDEE